MENKLALLLSFLSVVLTSLNTAETLAQALLKLTKHGFQLLHNAPALSRLNAVKLLQLILYFVDRLRSLL